MKEIHYNRTDQTHIMPNGFKEGTLLLARWSRFQICKFYEILVAVKNNRFYLLGKSATHSWEDRRGLKEEYSAISGSPRIWILNRTDIPMYMNFVLTENFETFMKDRL
jgi:hypothetical protein